MRNDPDLQTRIGMFVSPVSPQTAVPVEILETEPVPETAPVATPTIKVAELNKAPARYMRLEVNSCQLLSEAIEDSLFRKDTLSRRADAIVEMSFLLRQALSFREADMDPIPVQMGGDYQKARNYLIAETIRWVQNGKLDEIFEIVHFPEIHAKAVREILPMAINLDTLAIWLCEEFGHLRSLRQAMHARRYVATRMTSELLGTASRSPEDTNQVAERSQEIFDTWSNPLCEVHDALHYQKVIAPIRTRLVQIGIVEGPAEDFLAAANSNEAES